MTHAQISESSQTVHAALKIILLSGRLFHKLTILFDPQFIRQCIKNRVGIGCKTITDLLTGRATFRGHSDGRRHDHSWYAFELTFELCRHIETNIRVNSQINTFGRRINRTVLSPP